MANNETLDAMPQPQKITIECSHTAAPIYPGLRHDGVYDMVLCKRKYYSVCNTCVNRMATCLETRNRRHTGCGDPQLEFSADGRSCKAKQKGEAEAGGLELLLLLFVVWCVFAVTIHN
jgi:hypothetical protein